MSVISGTVGAVLGAKASKKASKTEAKSTEAATQAQLQMYYQSRQDLAPWRVSGASAIRQIMHEMGLPDMTFQEITGMEEPIAPEDAAPKREDYRLPGEPERDPISGDPIIGAEGFDENAYAQAYANWEAKNKEYVATKKQYDEELARYEDWEPAEFTGTPSYQFRLAEGQKGIERSALARGGALSGRTAKNLVRFGQDIGSAEYGDYMNRLMSTAGMGQVGSTQSANLASQTGSNLANISMVSGSQRAAGQRERGQIWSNFASQQGQNAMMAALAYYYGGSGGGGQVPKTMMI